MQTDFLYYVNLSFIKFQVYIIWEAMNFVKYYLGLPGERGFARIMIPQHGLIAQLARARA